MLRYLGLLHTKKHDHPQLLVTIFSQTDNTRYTLEDFHTDITFKPVYEKGRGIG